MCKRDFSKGFQVRESKGGNKVRFLNINQKRRIQGRNPVRVFSFGGFSVELRFDSRERTFERDSGVQKGLFKGFSGKEVKRGKQGKIFKH